MIRYLVRRLARAMLLLAGVSMAAFVLAELAPGDYFSEARLNPQISAETVAALRAQYGLDRPLASRYASWVASVFRGEWGFSLASNMQVWPLVWPRARNTLVLTVTATTLAWLIAIPVALWSAATRRRLGRLLTRGGVSILLSLPDLLVVLLLLLAAARTGLLPLGGMLSSGGSQAGFWTGLADLARHLALPATALVLASLPVLITHAQSAVGEVLASPFILAARANGIPRRRLLYRHALRAAANPLIALLGLSIGALLSSSLLVEAVMGWPGLGRLLLEATLERDAYVVIGVVMLSSVFLIGGSLVADLLLYWADPRIRRE